MRYIVTALGIFALLYAIYYATDTYLRWETRRRLEERHDAGEASALTREDFVQKGLAEYERSAEKKALLAIFVVPPTIIAILAFVLN